MPSRKIRPERRSDPGGAFFPEPDNGPVVANDALAENMGQEFLTSATSGEEATPDDHDAVQPEEEGGPFIETTADEELGIEDDEDEEQTQPTMPGSGGRKVRRSPSP